MKTAIQKPTAKLWLADKIYTIYDLLVLYENEFASFDFFYDANPDHLKGMRGTLIVGNNSYHTGKVYRAEVYRFAKPGEGDTKAVQVRCRLEGLHSLPVDSPEWFKLRMMEAKKLAKRL